MDVLKILTALSPVYSFKVYGEGESLADVETSDPAEAMEHITAQDMTYVYLWAQDEVVACLTIVCDPDPEIIDYGARNKNMMDLLDRLIAEE